jgi:1,4-alpha-glucan branching enzyme
MGDDESEWDVGKLLVCLSFIIAVIGLVLMWCGQEWGEDLFYPGAGIGVVLVCLIGGF